MKRLTLILTTCLTTLFLFGQTNIEEVWLTEYKGDSLTTEKFLAQIRFNSNNAHYRVLFDQNADTTETVITYFDKNGNDSIEIWKYPNDTASWTIHWFYNNKNQLIKKYTTKGDQINDDTIIYQYNSSGQLVKETNLFKSFHPFDSLIYKNGVLKEVISYSPDEISLRKKYQYSKNGQTKNITTFNEKGQKLRRFFFSYDSDGRKIKIKTTRYKTIILPNKLK